MSKQTNRELDQIINNFKYPNAFQKLKVLISLLQISQEKNEQDIHFISQIFIQRAPEIHRQAVVVSHPVPPVSTQTAIQSCSAFSWVTNSIKHIHYFNVPLDSFTQHKKI